MKRSNSGMTATQRLLSIASAPLAETEPLVQLPNVGGGTFVKELLEVLRERNGFYAFESALHVFPASPCRSMTIETWNSQELWRYEYGDIIPDNAFFFAEDAFGDQFGLFDEGICTFDSETGEVSLLAQNFEQWCERILQDYAVLTGYPLLHDWQVNNGGLPAATRLIPKIPFVLGGEYKIENLFVLDAVRGMRSRGNLARQIKDLPDGTPVEFRIIE